MTDPPKISRWRGLPAKVLFQAFVLSVPLLLLGAMTFYQTRYVVREVDSIIKETGAVSAAAREALAKLAEASYHARNNDRAMFEEAAHSFDLLMNALAWGTESQVFNRDNDGELQKQWQQSGWRDSIGPIHTSDKIRQFSAEILLYSQGFSKYMLMMVSSPGEAVSAPLSEEEALKKASKYEHLVVQNLRRLLDEVTQDALERRAVVVKLQFGQMRRSLFLSFLFFLIVALSTWFFSYRDIIKPIVRLTVQVEKARMGDRAARMLLKPKDELGALANSFNQLLEDLDKTTVSRNALAREIVERKVVEEKLRQSEKMGAVGQLAGGIAHDLNNGLTPVIGYLDMLLAEPSLSENAKGMLEEAKQSTLRCSEVVSKLMNFSRPTLQARAHLDIGKLLTDLKKILKPVFPATITLEVESTENAGTLYGNESDIMTVLMNLAINARDAMAKEGGKFTVKASGVGDKVFLHVSDTGTGIPADVLPRVFEPFFTTKAKGSGTGLGLAMVYNIVKEHGGTIEIASQLRKGTSFYIYLPRHPRGEGLAAQKAAPKQAESIRSDAPKGKGNVLFVDDEKVLRNMGKTFLENLGYTPYLAADGEEASKMYQEHHAKIAAIVLDMTMPKLSGLETIRRILAVDPSAKIVVASGYTAEGSIQDLLTAGAKAFIQKPYTIGQLAQALQKLIGVI